MLVVVFQVVVFLVLLFFVVVVVVVVVVDVAAMGKVLVVAVVVGLVSVSYKWLRRQRDGSQTPLSSSREPRARAAVANSNSRSSSNSVHSWVRVRAQRKNAEAREPVKVFYCDVCSCPPEYCSFQDLWPKCKPWLLANCDFVDSLYPNLRTGKEGRLLACLRRRER